jgi:uncharacterized protein (TIGR00369 family)
MAIVERISGLVSSGDKNFVRAQWDLLSRVPGGRRVFSELIGRAAPYTGTIQARVEDVRLGEARVTMPDVRGNRNHLSSIHAVALVNLAELAGNLALAYSLPDDARFIVAGLSIDYLKKARGTITAKGESPVPTTSARTEYDVLVTMSDAAGEVVAKATLRTLVGPKKSRGASAA